MSDDSSSPPPDSSATVLTLERRPEAAGSPDPKSSPELFAGRYALEALVGRGGMGYVYRARDVLVGDVVALKTLELGKEPGSDGRTGRARRTRAALPRP